MSTPSLSRTPLSRDGEGYKQRELEAIQKASEIETKTTVCMIVSPRACFFLPSFCIFH